MSTYYGVKCKTCDRENELAGSILIPACDDTFEKNRHDICDILIKYSKEITAFMEIVNELTDRMGLSFEDIPSFVLDFMYKHKGHTFVAYDEYGREVQNESL